MSSESRVFEINSQFEDDGAIDFGEVDAERIGRENMLFSADERFAFEHGGDLTNKWLDAVYENWEEREKVIIDTRYHDLKPGWFPAIPGWHLDDIPRGKDGQPDFFNPAYRAQHYLTLIGDEDGAASRTRFAQGKLKMEVPPAGSGAVLYELLNQAAERALTRGDMVHATVAQNRLYFFESFASLHEAQAAYPNPDNQRGWSRRWFGRISKDTERQALNVIRTTVNAYMRRPELQQGEVEMAGFARGFRELGVVPGATTPELMKEPMMLEAPLGFVQEHGGEVSRRLVNHLPDGWKSDDVVMTTGVYMVMPGWDTVLPVDPDFSVHTKMSADYDDDYLFCQLGDAVDVAYLDANFETNGGRLPASFAGHNPGMSKLLQGHGEADRRLQPGKFYQINGGGHLVSMPAKKSGWQYVAMLKRRRNSERVAEQIHSQVVIHLRDLYKGW